MAKQGLIQEVAHGIFKGVLLEDMITTVQRTHQLYCDVEIPDFYSGDFGHPLTRVPIWAMSLPLKKDDVVLVEFYQDDLTLPVLYKNPSELPKGYYEKFEFQDFIRGGNVTKPESKETLGATWLGDDSYIIKTSSYTVIHQNNGFILIDVNGNQYVYGSNVNVVSTGKTNIDCGGDCNIFTKGSFHVKGKSGTLDIN